MEGGVRGRINLLFFSGTLLLLENLKYGFDPSLVSPEKLYAKKRACSQVFMSEHCKICFLPHPF